MRIFSLTEETKNDEGLVAVQRIPRMALLNFFFNWKLCQVMFMHSMIFDFNFKYHGSERETTKKWSRYWHWYNQLLEITKKHRNMNFEFISICIFSISKHV